MNNNINIEELLERYFQADTTISEERSLREYFAGSEVPQHLQQYRTLFQTLGELTAEAAEKQAPKAFSLRSTVARLYRPVRPLMRAAACVAVVVMIGTAIDQGLTQNADTIVLMPSGSQSVGVEVSEWNGLQIIECEADTTFCADDLELLME